MWCRILLPAFFLLGGNSLFAAGLRPVYIIVDTLPDDSGVLEELGELDSDRLDLVIDETRSKGGRDFYELFYRQWKAPQNAAELTVTIRELPSRGLGSQLQIDVNGEILLQPFIQPRLEYIEAVAEQVVAILQEYLVQQANIDETLDQEDKSGTGIY